VSKFMSHYPGWRLTRTVDDIIDEILAFERGAAPHTPAPTEAECR